MVKTLYFIDRKCSVGEMLWNIGSKKCFGFYLTIAVKNRTLDVCSFPVKSDFVKSSVKEGNSSKVSGGKISTF